jgi:hypothetical protein
VGASERAAAADPVGCVFGRCAWAERCARRLKDVSASAGAELDAYAACLDWNRRAPPAGSCWRRMR